MKRCRRISTMLLVVISFVLIVSSCVKKIEGHPAEAAGFSGGIGTAADPWQVASWKELDNIRNFLNDHFIQVADLSSNTEGYDDYAGGGSNDGKGWLPLGTFSENFKGSYDGNGYKIADLIVNRGGQNYVGLFGWTAQASITHIALENATITGKNSTGALVGKYENGTIENCYTTGTVFGQSYVGGMLGVVDNAMIKNCYSTVSVSADYIIGGLVGWLINNSRIENCYTTGSVSGGDSAGGFTGRSNNSTVENCYAAGSVSGGNSVNGFEGSNVLSAIQNSFWDNEMAPGLPDDGRGKSTLEMKSKQTFEAANWDLQAVWAIEEGGYRSYPYLIINQQNPIPGYELIP